MEIVNQLSQSLGTYLAVDHRLIALLLLIVLGALVHLLLSLLVSRFHRLVSVTNHRWDDVLATALEHPAKLIVWLGVLFLSLELLPQSQGFQQLMLQLVDTALVLLVGWFLHRMIAGAEIELLREDRGRRDSGDRATVMATAKLVRVAMWVVVGLMIMQSMGASISGLLAFGGIGGIAVGFAAKDMLANFFGGLSIYLDRPFTIGDWIRSPDKPIEGTVEDIGWRLTRIRTFDQRPLYVPNAIFSQISVENPSRMFNRRIYETIGLRYQDSDKVAAIVEQVRDMLSHHPDIDLSKTLIVNFVSFGLSSLDFFVYTFTKTTNWVEFHGIKQDVLLKILAIIHDNGADVAFPTQTLHVNAPVEEPLA